MRFPADIVARLTKSYEGRAVCVTGGAGFIGGHLVDALHSLGARVSVIDDLSNSTVSHLAELMEIEPDRIRFTQGSILEDQALHEAIQDAEIVFHLAAIGSVPRSIAEPERTWVVNADGTLRVLEAARRVNAKRVVLAGSSSVYGDNPTLPRLETHAPSPMSPYAVSKLAAEALCATWSRTYGLSTATLRYFNVFGPRQPADSAYAAVVAAFASRLLAGQSLEIYGTGDQTRDFTFVSNAVLATLLAGSAERKLMGEAMNVGTGRRISILQLATMMAQAAGDPGARPTFKPARVGDVAHSQADISRAGDLLGYAPIATLEQGLEETVEYYRRLLARA